MVSGRVRLAAGNIVAVAAITEVEEAIVGTRHLAAGITLVGAHVGIVSVAEIVTREGLARRRALVTLVTGILSRSGAVSGTTFGTGVGSGEDGGGAVPKKASQQERSSSVRRNTTLDNHFLALMPNTWLTNDVRRAARLGWLASSAAQKLVASRKPSMALNEWFQGTANAAAFETYLSAVWKSTRSAISWRLSPTFMTPLCQLV